MSLLFESVIDITRDGLSPQVFDNPKSDNPTLKHDVLHKIRHDVGRISADVQVENYFIKGSILTNQWTRNADIDIFIQIDSTLTDDELRDLLYDTWSEIDDSYEEGISHPFQYYLSSKSYDFDNTEAAYDVENLEWIKKPTTKSIDIDDYMSKYRKYVSKFADYSEELRRDVIDYEILKEIPRDDVKGIEGMANSQLERIESDIIDYLDTYAEVRDMRQAAFSGDMTPAELKQYGVKSKLPGNVIFKFIERYHYQDLAKKLRAIIGKDKELDEREYEELNKILKTKLTNETTSFKSVFKPHTKGRGDMQHKAKHRQQDMSAGLKGIGDRKSLKLVPDYVRHSPLKAEREVDNAKKNTKIIRVKQGSPQANFYAKKYRIEDPTGTKTVAGNQNDVGIKIVFEESTILGTCQSEELINDIFGSVTDFAQAVEEYGDNFKYGNYIIKYNDDLDIHTFYLNESLEQKIERARQVLDQL